MRSALPASSPRPRAHADPAGPPPSLSTVSSPLTGTEAAAELIRRIRRGTRSRWPTPDAVRAGMTRELDQVSQQLARDPALLAAWSDGVDVPGETYEALVGGSARRELGQFQTPFLPADIMAAWLMQEPIDTLLDPGVGTGRLLFRAAARGGQIGRLVGFDIDDLALHMAHLNLTIRNARADLHYADFLVDDDILDAAGLVDKPPDALISNPPFSRHQALSRARKDLLRCRVRERLGVHVTGYTALHAYFLLRAFEVAAAGARLAFITPAGWLDVEYGKPIKRYLLGHAHVEAVILFGSRHQVFPRAMTTAAITLIRKSESTGGSTRIVRVGRQVDVPEVMRALRGEKTRLRTANLALKSSGRWSAPAARPKQGTPLRELALVRRGIATGNNAFFVISEQRRREWDIDVLLLRGCLYRPRLFPDDVIRERDLDALPPTVRRWILNSPHADHDERDDGLGRYLRWGKDKAAADQSYLAAHRAVWHQPEERGSCGIVLPYMNRGLPHFILNRAAAVPVNSFHVIEPLDRSLTAALWHALNDPAVLRQVKRLGRDYGRGLWKIEPGDLRNIHVVLP